MICPVESVGMAWMIAFLVTLVATILVHPVVVSVAQKMSVYDNPNERKLQRRPVPLLGGVAVFFGMLVGLAVTAALFDVATLLPVFVAMVFMLIIGTIDDIKGLSPMLRFVAEILLVILLILFTGMSLNDFQGLWGINEVPVWVAYPVTIFAIVGIINAINLIDGVDGLSSGFCIMASAMFGILFCIAGDVNMVAVTLVSIGALLPFFFHNVFGKSSKMFIGDGGTLMMGVVISLYVVTAISAGGKCESLVAEGFGVIPFTMAVLAVPVFDTLRVMLLRILRHTSPFHPDKTHLHHLFIELGFSHAGTTVSVLTLNSLVVLMWWISYYLGASVDIQLYVVILCSLAITFAFYKFMRIQISRDTIICRAMRRIGKLTCIERRGVWLFLQRLVDGKVSQAEQIEQEK